MSRSRRIGMAAAALAAVLAAVGAYPVRASAQATVTPNGPYTYWNWPGSGFYNTDERLTVLGHTAGTHYFWAHQFAFNGGDGGYLGLQVGSWPNNTKIALFSVWSATAASGPNCGTFSGEGTGYTCRIDPYDWVLGRTYRLRVWETTSDASGRWYGAWVQDTVTGVDSYVGSIRVPLTWQGLTGWVSWTEYFGAAVGSCSKLPWAKARWEYPTANAGTIAITSHSNAVGTSGTCPKWTTITDVPGGVVQEMGNQALR